MKKKIRKSTWVAWAFLVYISATAIYLLPRNGEISSTEKWVTVGVAYIVVALLWWVLRNRENMKAREQQEKEATLNNNKKI